MTYPVFLGAVVVDTSNNAIRLTEAGTPYTATIASGTYYLRGDGASGDLCAAIVTALDATAGGNTYAVTVAFDIDGDNVSAVVTIARATGTDAFQILWSNTSTTFDEALLGFTSASLPNPAGTTSSSTLSPSCVWVSSDIYREFDAEDEDDAFANRALSGYTYGGSNGEFDVRRLGMDFVVAKRAHEMWIAADPTRAFNVFRRRCIGGLPFELHFGTISSGSALAALSSSTEQGDRFVMHEANVDGFDPRRLSPAMALYSFDLRLSAYVAP